MTAVWVGILGICAAPIALPLALVLDRIDRMCLSRRLLLSCSPSSSQAYPLRPAGSSAPLQARQCCFSSFADGLCNLGFGLGCFGAGLLFTYGSVLLFGWAVRKLSVFLGRITKGGRKK